MVTVRNAGGFGRIDNRERRMIPGFFSVFFAFLFFFNSYAAYGVGFQNSDLAGEWSGYFLESRGHIAYWIYGDLTVDNTGSVLEGRWEAASGTQGDFVDSILTIDEGGFLSGILRTRVDGDTSVDTMTLTHGKMDRQKNMVQAVVLKELGVMDFVTLIRKADTVLSTTDLTGKWAGFQYNTNGVIHEYRSINL